MKSWIKDWIDPGLNGPDRKDMTPAQRSVWQDLKRLAAASSNEGTIIDDDGGPPSKRRLCRAINISHGLLDSTLRICENTGRVRQDEYGIHLVTWEQEQITGNGQLPVKKGKLENTDPDKYIKGKYGHIVQR